MEDREIPTWDEYYKEKVVEEMPWYEKDLDKDVVDQIKSKNLTGGRFLDLGTGPGTQAVELAKLGFAVTATDLSENAILKAKKLSDMVHFFQDDFLDTKLPDNEFDYILDRGCFHIFEKEQRPSYHKQLNRILNKNGIYFLKCMSIYEKVLPDGKGPHKFSKQELEEEFSNDFEILDIKESVYYGTERPLPKTWFAVFRKKF